METLLWKNHWGESGHHVACQLMSEPMQEGSQPWPKGFRENRVLWGEGFPWGKSMSNKRRDYLRKEDTEGFPGSTQITKRTQQSVEHQWSILVIQKQRNSLVYQEVGAHILTSEPFLPVCQRHLVMQWAHFSSLGVTTQFWIIYEGPPFFSGPQNIWIGRNLLGPNV